jgi:hypothetical protein
MSRRIAEALLLALLLLAVQTAILAHAHEGSAAPGGAAAQSCEFCAGHAAGAPPPAAAGSATPALRAVVPPAFARPAAPPARFNFAHPSRAPPQRRSS